MDKFCVKGGVHHSIPVGKGCKGPILSDEIIFEAVMNIGKTKTNRCDPDRTQTCNPQIRSLVPYPLGHRTLLSEFPI